MMSPSVKSIKGTYCTKSCQCLLISQHSYVFFCSAVALKSKQSSGLPSEEKQNGRRSVTIPFFFLPFLKTDTFIVLVFHIIFHHRHVSHMSPTCLPLACGNHHTHSFNSISISTHLRVPFHYRAPCPSFDRLSILSMCSDYGLKRKKIAMDQSK